MLDITQCNLDDPEVWDMISSGRVKGCFQIEGYLGREWARRLKPKNINELSDLIALIRPGCVSGDTIVYIKRQPCGTKVMVPLSELYKEQGTKYKQIYSYNENDGSLVQNDVKTVSYSGQKECFKVLINRYSRKKNTDINFYNLECTDDHKLLTPNGWVELQNLNIGDRIAIVKRDGSNRKSRKETVGSRHHSGVKIKNTKHLKYFQEICYQHYEQKCIICGWNETSLDVNHIHGNRHVDNSPENLCYLCPNHHRLFTDGKITHEELIKSREKYKLKTTKETMWGTYMGKESVGIKDTYDISMLAPNHNFIAGHVVVHNCLDMADDYAKRKAGTEEIKSLHPLIDDVLKPTQGIIVYQEQSMKIAEILAGFSLEQADILRRAIGKKKAGLMNEVRTMFVDGCVANNISKEKAEEVFDIIERSNRYSFNKCLDPSTVVETPNGLKTLDELKIGDKVLSPKNSEEDEYVDVVDIIESGEKEVFEVTLDNGMSIICTLDHKFMCQDGKKYTLLEILENNLEVMVYNDMSDSS